MLNQNYPRCIFIRTDCEIWAAKTWVIVSLETDITHFPSRSWQWHANSVLNVCLFVWLLCTSVKEAEDEIDWKDAGWWEEGVGGRWEFYKGVTCSVWWRRNRAVFLHILPLTHLLFNFLLITFPRVSLWSSPLHCFPSSRTDRDSLETIFTLKEMKKKQTPRTSVTTK